ncbi:class I SAM-dependent methyltransferase [bacterium]|nr:class I SAM-dependent methyltransferase [bacterium]MBU1994907.1 class I SAM-dependent methyltransferase [bacterium]
MRDDHKAASAWFEELYKENYNKNENIPWAKMQPNEHLLEYIKNNLLGKRCLVVGCGLGDDAITLSEAGADVTAIDISHSAIKWCKERFDGYGVNFIVQDIFELPPEMIGAYDFVFESLTIQSLPLVFRNKIITAISSLLSPDGKILIVAHGKKEGEKKEGPPWPLEINELKLFGTKGLNELEFSIMEEMSNISAYKFKAVYQKERS